MTDTRTAPVRTAITDAPTYQWYVAGQWRDAPDSNLFDDFEPYTGGNQSPTVPELKEVLSGSAEIDRTQINSWEDADFRRAVEATGRKKLIITALWTEVCLAFPALDAMREDYEVYPVVDAVGGTSVEAHRAGLQRIVQAGAQPISWVSLACELLRDWARVETVPEVVDIVLTSRLLKGV
jgi:nicotinamidase-related amidase